MILSVVRLVAIRLRATSWKSEKSDLFTDAISRLLGPRLSIPVIRDEARKDLTPFQAWRDNNGFWSDFGYDGLSLVFDVPLADLQKLPDSTKMALFRLMVYLADTPDDPLHTQVQALATQSAEQRLTALLDLSAQFSA